MPGGDGNLRQRMSAMPEAHGAARHPGPPSRERPGAQGVRAILSLSQNCRSRKQRGARARGCPIGVQTHTTQSPLASSAVMSVPCTVIAIAAPCASATRIVMSLPLPSTSMPRPA